MKLLLALLCFPSLALAQAPNLAALDIVERSVPAGPVALVDGAAVSREDFLRMYHEQLGAVAAASSGKADDNTRVKTALAVLGELIQQEVLHQEAQRRNIQVTDAAAGQAYQKQLEELQSEAQKKGAPVPSEADVLKRIGKTREEALHELRRALLIRAISEQITGGKPKAAVTDAQVKEFYTKNAESFQRAGAMHLKQMYIKPKPNAQQATPEQWAAAQNRIEQALKRIHAGESFEAVARDMSDAPDKQQGGDMGNQPVEKLPPFYVDVARQLKPGEISKIFKTQLGLHFIQLVTAEGAGTVSLEEAAPRIRTFLERSKGNDAVDEFCQNVMTNPRRVKVYLQLDRTLAGIPELQSTARQQ